MAYPGTAMQLPAEMQDRLLAIALKREVPEEAKPRMIPINGTQPAIEGKKAN